MPELLRPIAPEEDRPRPNVRKLRDLLWRAGGIAPHDDDPRAGVPLAKLPDDLSALGISLSRHRASVHDAQIGNLIGRGIASLEVTTR